MFYETKELKDFQEKLVEIGKEYGEIEEKTRKIIDARINQISEKRKSKQKENKVKLEIYKEEEKKEKTLKLKLVQLAHGPVQVRGIMGGNDIALVTFNDSGAGVIHKIPGNIGLELDDGARIKFTKEKTLDAADNLPYKQLHDAIGKISSSLEREKLMDFSMFLLRQVPQEKYTLNINYVPPGQAGDEQTLRLFTDGMCDYYIFYSDHKKACSLYTRCSEGHNKQNKFTENINKLYKDRKESI